MLFRSVPTLIALLIVLVSFELAVEPIMRVICIDMINNKPHTILRSPEDDVAEYVDSLNEHRKK